MAKKKNAELGQWWTPDLELAGRRMVMSCQRGMGPPRPSDPLNYEAILMLDMGTEAIVPHGPINTKALAVMGTMFMTREIEIALAERSHISVDKKQQLITWRLPVSKTDPQAIGCSRSWGGAHASMIRSRRVRLPHHGEASGAAGENVWRTTAG